MIDINGEADVDSDATPVYLPIINEIDENVVVPTEGNAVANSRQESTLSVIQVNGITHPVDNI